MFRSAREVPLYTVALWLLFAGCPGRALEVPEDPQLSCDRAAARAEREGPLPEGLLAAIGTVESGRLDASGLHRRAWPWSINAEGSSYFAATRGEAVYTVRSLQARGYRYIDVGCFQVDLAFHPHAFATLEDAFDPDANARAASRILLLARFATTGWDQAVAQYHSASLLRGAWYLQKVQAVWPAARARLVALDFGSARLPQYAALLSAEARLVRVVTARDPAPAPIAGLPRVISPADAPDTTRLLKFTGTLPRVLSPPEDAVAAPRRSGRL